MVMIMPPFAFSDLGLSLPYALRGYHSSDKVEIPVHRVPVDFGYVRGLGCWQVVFGTRKDARLLLLVNSLKLHRLNCVSTFF